MRVVRYEACHEEIWNRHIRESKNGSFLFDRGYMGYHAERFTDHSLLFFDERDRLAGVLPASLHGTELVSHGGLTYGGIVSNEDMKTSTMVRLFDAMLGFLRAQGVSRLCYKAIPHIFHRIPADEDLYALFLHDARLYRRDASSAIYLPDRLRFAKGKREGVRKANKAGLVVSESLDFESFFAIGEKLMRERHGLAPVHSSDEMSRLATLFPENIRLHASFSGNQMLAGAITYVFAPFVHLQYMYNCDEGMELGALDLVLDHLITGPYGSFKYLSFGVSTEDGGRFLNQGLMHQKEMFGARSVVHDFYEINLT